MQQQSQKGEEEEDVLTWGSNSVLIGGFVFA